jgi:hypothetical protein
MKIISRSKNVAGMNIKTSREFTVTVFPVLLVLGFGLSLVLCAEIELRELFSKSFADAVLANRKFHLSWK